MNKKVEDKIKKEWGKVPKILIGCPVYKTKDYAMERFTKRVKELDYPNYDILMADNSRDDSYMKRLNELGLPAIKTKWYDSSRGRLCVARNELKKVVLEGGYDFFFSLESDVIPPKNIITELLQWGKQVIGGWYYIGKPNESRPCLSRGWKKVEVKNGFVMSHLYPFGKEMAKNRLMKTYLGSMGCMMIHREVLEKVKFRVCEQMSWHDDSFFFYDLDKLKIPVYVDTDMLVPHFQSGWDGVNW